jgi:hypothetical protein
MPMTEVFISFSYFKSVQSKSFAIRKTFKSIRENPRFVGNLARQPSDCMQRNNLALSGRGRREAAGEGPNS